MNIHENTALLDAFADGELTADELAEIRAHLDTCPDCRAYVDDVLAIRAAFPAVDDCPPPPDFTKKVMDAVAKTPQARPKKQPWGKLLTAAACLAVIVLVQRVGLGGTAENADTAAYAADCTASESVAVERSMEPTANAETEEMQTEQTDDCLDDAAVYETSGSLSGETNGTLTVTDGNTEGDAAPTEKAEDAWVEGPGGNVIFYCTIYLSVSEVGNALDGYEGKPFSTTYEPEKGIIGTGYALEQADFEHILYDVLHRPAEVPSTDYTTELCCIVVTAD